MVHSLMRMLRLLLLPIYRSLRIFWNFANVCCTYFWKFKNRVGKSLRSYWCDAYQLAESLEEALKLANDSPCWAPVFSVLAPRWDGLSRAASLTRGESQWWSEHWTFLFQRHIFMRCKNNVQVMNVVCRSFSKCIVNICKCLFSVKDPF